MHIQIISCQALNILNYYIKFEEDVEAMKKMGFRSIKNLMLVGGFAMISLICAIILIMSSMFSKQAFRVQVEEDMQVLA